VGRRVAFGNRDVAGKRRLGNIIKAKQLNKQSTHKRMSTQKGIVFIGMPCCNV
jgi:hypothetical protein